MTPPPYLREGERKGEGRTGEGRGKERREEERRGKADPKASDVDVHLSEPLHFSLHSVPVEPVSCCHSRVREEKERKDFPLSQGRFF